MNRRDFLKGLLGAGLFAATPTLAVALAKKEAKPVTVIVSDFQFDYVNKTVTYVGDRDHITLNDLYRACMQQWEEDDELACVDMTIMTDA